MTEPPTSEPGEPAISPPRKPRSRPPPKPATPWERIKQHKVMQWTLAYAAMAYTLLHVTEMVNHAFEGPAAVVRLLTMVLIVGIPVAAILAWYHGHRALHRVSGPELTMITVMLVIAGSILWAVTRTNEAKPQVQAATNVAPTALAAPRTAIAVMPFANLTGDATKEYLGDGMAEEVINTLTRVQGLQVPARTSTFAYKGRNTDIRQIAKDLGVGTILEGSVRAAGKRIRITAQLINAPDGLHIWSETFDEEFTDIFKLQDKLAAAIAAALQPNLLSAAEAAVAQGPPTKDVEAYNLYLQGVSLVQRPSEQNAAKAIEYFEQALKRDPKFALAYAGIAGAQETWGSLSGRGTEHGEAAERAARQALALDPNVAAAHLALAVIYARRSQALEMEAHRRAAVSLAPNDGTLRATSALLMMEDHRKQVLEEAEKAYSLAPASPVVVAMLADQHAKAGHDREAAKYADAAVDLGYPKDQYPLTEMHELIAWHAGRYAEAAEFATRNMDVRNPEEARTAEVIRLVYAALADPGQRNAALAARNRLYPPSGNSVVAGAMHGDMLLCMKSSYYYALLDANDVAYGLGMECFGGWAPGEYSSNSGNSNFPGWFLPELRAFRRDPRFQAFQTRFGMMEYWQKYGPPDDCNLKDGRLMCH
jgi:TolB-like protein/Tfp pilus assembly protein PilF